jgi:hypothetical protein
VSLALEVVSALTKETAGKALYERAWTSAQLSRCTTHRHNGLVPEHSYGTCTGQIKASI